ncbi:hypothetical protein THICB2_590131 [Thiomonas sp. CB2]|nr:hypothetical protein THICB2_590131 [Thiomonas sp. CB2]VDY03932.1 protein of unknown function [Thiomonas sp. Bio17B3]VDY08897.1 protein of unknown function [Thiomonas sp. Sup16B3]VDY12178.1 conserved protein of unknown function [Thiomonas sp. OC7]VDY18607.1 protein of unknown function [Thiomonas sp. CB2]
MLADPYSVRRVCRSQGIAQSGDMV